MCRGFGRRWPWTWHTSGRWLHKMQPRILSSSPSCTGKYMRWRDRGTLSCRRGRTAIGFCHWCLKIMNADVKFSHFPTTLIRKKARAMHWNIKSAEFYDHGSISPSCRRNPWEVNKRLCCAGSDSTWSKGRNLSERSSHLHTTWTTISSWATQWWREGGKDPPGAGKYSYCRPGLHENAKMAEMTWPQLLLSSRGRGRGSSVNF